MSSPKHNTAGARLGPLSPHTGADASPRPGAEGLERATANARTGAAGRPGAADPIGTGEAHGGRVSTAKGMAEGSDLACEGRAARRRPPEAVTAPRNNPARADGAAPAQASLRAGGRRAGSGVCIPGLRLLTQNAPPRAPEIPLPLRQSLWLQYALQRVCPCAISAVFRRLPMRSN